jgi:hypothetical protein
MTVSEDHVSWNQVCYCSKIHPWWGQWTQVLAYNIATAAALSFSSFGGVLPL